MSQDKPGHGERDDDDDADDDDDNDVGKEGRRRTRRQLQRTITKYCCRFLISVTVRVPGTNCVLSGFPLGMNLSIRNAFPKSLFTGCAAEVLPHAFLKHRLPVPMRLAT